MALNEGISPLSVTWAQNMRQKCTVYTYQGADYSGQPIYSEGTEWPCRMAVKTARTVTQEGDVISNSAVEVVLPADCPVQAYDQIDLPNGYQMGAVIGKVLTPADQWGKTTHKVVTIL